MGKECSPDLSEKALRVSNLSFTFENGRVIFHEACFTMDHPSIVSVIGLSGSGKTTFLRLVSGLISHPHDCIEVFGRPPGTARRERLIGLVHQRPVLLRWRTVEQNIRLAAEITGDSSAIQGVREICEAVGLAGAMPLFPSQLSQGMAARASLARTLLLAPRLILLDEPFAHVDEVTRRQLQELLRGIHLKNKLSCLFVTHNLEEAVFLSDQVVVLDMTAKKFTDPIEVRFGPYRTNDLRYSEGFRATLKCVWEYLQGSISGPVLHPSP